jgi:hypothetical protein
MIYTHCVLRESGDVISPLDALTQSKIVPFTTHAVQSTALADRGALALNGVA